MNGDTGEDDHQAAGAQKNPSRRHDQFFSKSRSMRFVVLCSKSISSEKVNGRALAMWSFMLSRKVATVSVVVGGALGALVLAWTLSAGFRKSAVDRRNAAVADVEHARDDERIVSEAARLDALARAQIWREPAVRVSSAQLSRPHDTPQLVTCRFRRDALGCTTAKFNCDVDGDKVRIKYGAGPELPAEAAATRLLRALGFGADDVSLVRRLRCEGCPAEPFVIAKVVEATHT